MYEFYGYQGVELRIDDAEGEVRAFSHKAGTPRGGRVVGLVEYFVSEGINPAEYSKARRLGGVWHLLNKSTGDFIVVTSIDGSDVFKDRRLMNRFKIE